jgi:hypothetical protein
VARIVTKLLSELGVRAGSKFVEKTGQELVSEGASKFGDTLKAATPGVLFIDEVYQLAPATSAEGAAITNQIMKVSGGRGGGW